MSGSDSFQRATSSDMRKRRIAQPRSKMAHSSRIDQAVGNIFSSTPSSPSMTPSNLPTSNAPTASTSFGQNNIFGQSNAGFSFSAGPNASNPFSAVGNNSNGSLNNTFSGSSNFNNTSNTFGNAAANTNGTNGTSSTGFGFTPSSNASSNMFTSAPSTSLFNMNASGNANATPTNGSLFASQDKTSKPFGSSFAPQPPSGAGDSNDAQNSPPKQTFNPPAFTAFGSPASNTSNPTPATSGSGFLGSQGQNEITPGKAGDIDMDESSPRKHPNLFGTDQLNASSTSRKRSSAFEEPPSKVAATSASFTSGGSTPFKLGESASLSFPPAAASPSGNKFGGDSPVSNPFSKISTAPTQQAANVTVNGAESGATKDAPAFGLFGQVSKQSSTTNSQTSAPEKAAPFGQQPLPAPVSQTEPKDSDSGTSNTPFSGFKPNLSGTTPSASPFTFGGAPKFNAPSSESKDATAPHFFTKPSSSGLFSPKPAPSQPASTIGASLFGTSPQSAPAGEAPTSATFKLGGQETPASKPLQPPAVPASASSFGDMFRQKASQQASQSVQTTSEPAPKLAPSFQPSATTSFGSATAWDSDALSDAAVRKSMARAQAMVMLFNEELKRVSADVLAQNQTAVLTPLHQWYSGECRRVEVLIERLQKDTQKATQAARSTAVAAFERDLSGFKPAGVSEEPAPEKRDAGALKPAFGTSTTPSTKSKTLSTFENMLQSTPAKEGSTGAAGGAPWTSNAGAGGASIFASQSKPQASTSSLFQNIKPSAQGNDDEDEDEDANGEQEDDKSKGTPAAMLGKSLFERGPPSKSLFDRITPSATESLASGSPSSTRENTPSGVAEDSGAESTKSTEPANSSGVHLDGNVPDEQTTLDSLNEQERRENEVLVEVSEARLMQFDSAQKTWEKKGLGRLYLIRNRESGTCRVLSRNPAGKVLLNTQLLAQGTYASPKKARVTLPAVGREGGLQTWLVTVKEDETAQELLRQLEQHKAAAAAAAGAA